MQPDVKPATANESAAIDFNGFWIKSLCTLELWLSWFLALKPEAEPGLSTQLRNLIVTLKENAIVFASPSVSVTREREVAAHLSTSAIKGKISSYRLKFISSMLCAQQTLESRSLLLLSFCSTDQAVE